MKNVIFLSMLITFSIFSGAQCKPITPLIYNLLKNPNTNYVPECTPETLNLCSRQSICELNTGYWYDRFSLCNDLSAHDHDLVGIWKDSWDETYISYHPDSTYEGTEFGLPYSGEWAPVSPTEVIRSWGTGNVIMNIRMLNVDTYIVEGHPSLGEYRRISSCTSQSLDVCFSRSECILAGGNWYSSFSICSNLSTRNHAIVGRWTDSLYPPYATVYFTYNSDGTFNGIEFGVFPFSGDWAPISSTEIIRSWGGLGHMNIRMLDKYTYINIDRPLTKYFKIH